MFSQFRQAVESLGPIASPSSDKATEGARLQASSSRSNSLDSARGPLSSSQLAESALSNLRKSLASQRSGSVGSVPKSPASSPSPSREGRTKSTLEDRLRAAAFAIGDASSTSNSVETSRKPSPSTSLTSQTETTHAGAVVLEDQKSSSSTLDLEENQMQDSTEIRKLENHAKVTEKTEPISLPQSTIIDSTSNSMDNVQPQSENVEISESPLHHKPSTSTFLVSSDCGASSESDNTQHTKQERIPLSGVDEVSAAQVTSVPLEVETSIYLGELSSASNTATLVSESHPPLSNTGISLEDLQEKLKQVEQRFTDVSVSFRHLQAEKEAADLVLRELTPVESIRDNLTLHDYLRGLISKNQILQDEVNQVSSKLQTQETRSEELLNARQLESSSLSAQIEKFQTQVSEAEALLQAAQNSAAHAEGANTKLKAEIEQLRKELERSHLVAKEEEEKRVKAISLLKTVRQKLVKAEKEKEDAIKEKNALQAKDKEEREREEAEKARLRNDLNTMDAEREKAMLGLKAQFDRELASMKDRYETELIATRGQYELESTVKKNAQAQEISAKDIQIRILEQSLAQVTKDKNNFFDDLQLRQAELESAQSHLESLQSQNTEYQYQLRELNDRYMLLKEDLSEAQREQEGRSHESASSADEVARALSTAEAKYEMKISELRKNLNIAEKERNDSEAQWSQKLRDKTQALESLKKLVGSASEAEQEHEDTITELKTQFDKSEGERRLLEGQLRELQQRNIDIREAEVSWRTQEETLTSKITALDVLVEDSKQREAQLRLANKTLRDELRKVQSSVALLERQRNPGVGYWTSRSNDNTLPSTTQTPVNSALSDVGSRAGSPAPSLGEKTANEEEVNLEYLRNVILQFLEHKEMRPNLVKVLSIILRFTPQETRRLTSKV